MVIQQNKRKSKLTTHNQVYLSSYIPSLQNLDPVVLLSQQLQVAPPARVGEWNQQYRCFIGAGRRFEASTGVHASLFQRQSFLFSGKILQHARVMELHLLQRVSEGRTTGRFRVISFLSGIKKTQTIICYFNWIISDTHIYLKIAQLIKRP